MTNTEIKKLYNVVKVVSAQDLPNLVKTYKDNLDLIIVMMKKKKANNQPPKYFKDFVKQNNKVLQQILKRLGKTENLLLKVIKLNNLKTQ